MIFKKCDYPLLPDNDFDMDSLLDEVDSLKISISDNLKNIIVLQFNDHFAYRCRDEGDALKTLNQIRLTGGLGYTLYEVTNSEFIKWFLEERTYECEGLRHFCVLTLNWVIDVISLTPPALHSSSDYCAEKIFGG